MQKTRKNVYSEVLVGDTMCVHASDQTGAAVLSDLLGSGMKPCDHTLGELLSNFEENAPTISIGADFGEQTCTNVEFIECRFNDARLMGPPKT